VILNTFYLDPFCFRNAQAPNPGFVEYYKGKEGLDRGTNHSPIPNLNFPTLVLKQQGSFPTPLYSFTCTSILFEPIIKFQP
jgi:hypothetical protein